MAKATKKVKEPKSVEQTIWDSLEYVKAGTLEEKLVELFGEALGR